MKQFLIILAFTACACAHRDSRVIGGRPTNAGEYPFVAAITTTTSTGVYFCGGTLISDRWLVTSAQCADGATKFTIKLGSRLLTGVDSNRVTVATSTYILHPEYNPLTLENDIALIELRESVQFSDYLSPVPVIREEPWDKLTPIVLGWGQRSDSDPNLSEELIFVFVAALTNEECKLTYGNQIVDTMVCVEGNSNEGLCHGDIGGPLALPASSGLTQFLGVASFVSGKGCETLDPSGYTRIYPYVPWIKNLTNVA